LTPLFQKLNFKDHSSIVLQNSPESFKVEMREMSKVTTVLEGADEAGSIDFVLCFAVRIDEIKDFLSKNISKLQGDAIIWICYPKQSSKKYKSEINRDMGWEFMAEHELEPVRQVAIDEDWSALRFRKVSYIKNITRRESFAVTDEAKKRTTQKGI